MRRRNAPVPYLLRVRYHVRDYEAWVAAYGLARDHRAVTNVALGALHMALPVIVRRPSQVESLADDIAAFLGNETTVWPIPMADVLAGSRHEPAGA